MCFQKKAFVASPATGAPQFQSLLLQHCRNNSGRNEAQRTSKLHSIPRNFVPIPFIEFSALLTNCYRVIDHVLRDYPACALHITECISSHSRLVMRPQLSCVTDKLLDSLVFLIRWLQLLFDFDSTAVQRSFECLSKVIGHTDVIRVPPFRLAASVSWCWS